MSEQISAAEIKHLDRARREAYAIALRDVMTEIATTHNGIIRDNPGRCGNAVSKRGEAALAGVALCRDAVRRMLLPA